MHAQHHYQLTVQWTGNKGPGTTHYTSYGRDHLISVDKKPDLPGSADPAFRGDQTRHNPEDLLLASLSSCHMLWYLHLCADAGVVVTGYTDRATGILQESPAGGHFTEVTLHPQVTVADAGMIAQANALHEKAHKMCFIANSVNFPVGHQPVCTADK